jgi:hypothetical protein
MHRAFLHRCQWLMGDFHRAEKFSGCTVVHRSMHRFMNEFIFAQARVGR